MTVSDTLDGCFKLLRATWPTGMIALLVLFGGFGLVAVLAFVPLFRELSTLGPAADPSLGVLLPLPLVLLGYMLVTVAAAVAVLWAVREREAGRRPTVGAAVGQGLRRSPGLLVVTFLTYVGLMVAIAVVGLVIFGLVQLDVPGIVAAVLVGLAALALLLPWAVAVPQIAAAAIVLEGRGALNALGRAVRVVARRFWRSVGTVWLVTLLSGVLGGGVSIVFLPLALFGEVGIVVSSVLQQVVVSLASVPLTAGVGAMLLLDASARLDGADLVARVHPGTPPPSPW